MAEINTTILFGVVTMGLSEVLRRQFQFAYGQETHSTFCYVGLVVSFFVAVHIAFTSHLESKKLGG